jgi:hypothetical protein
MLLKRYSPKDEHRTLRFPSEWKQKHKFLPTAPYPKTQTKAQKVRKYDKEDTPSASPAHDVLS